MPDSNLIARFAAYAADFERTFADDDWSSLEPHFTEPAFLECGRQISPQFREASRFLASDEERVRELRARLQAEGRLLHRRPGTIVLEGRLERERA